MNPKAACVLMFNSRNEVLAVSRRGERTQFGLPGGKVDDGETVIQAAIRELREETGIVVLEDDLEFLYSSDDGHGYDVTTFVITWPIQCTYPLTREPDMLVEWVSPRVLIDGPFGKYNTHVLLAELMRVSIGNE